MPMKERPEEVQARSCVEKVLGVALEHADQFGGVDYKFRTRRGDAAALEVTTVTSSETKRGMSAWVKERDRARQGLRSIPLRQLYGHCQWQDGTF